VHKLALQPRLSESQSSFRAIRTSVLRQLDLRGDHVEQEMIIKMLRRASG
jgi:hypothetical protein